MSQNTVSPPIRQRVGNPAMRRRWALPLFPGITDLQAVQKSVAASGLAALYMPAALVITLGAFALRLVMLDRFPFREDEAAYAYWALHGWLEDPLFLAVWPDKPPLFLWLLGGAFHLFGVSEASARWINVAASTLLVPVVAATANRLWGRRAALTAAVVLALNPYAISFGSTAYTDPVLVLAGMLAFCLAAYGRALWAGLLLGAAVMTKQQGVLYSPLVIGGLWLAVEPSFDYVRRLLRKYFLLALGAALATLPILYWDSLRWAVAPSPWDLSVRNYASLALLPPAEWPGRVSMWRPLLWDLAASWTSWAALASLLLGGALVGRLAAVRAMLDLAGVRRERWILLLAGWSLVFMVAHVVTTVQPWDRYLLPLTPMLALGAGWAMSRLSVALPVGQMVALAIVGFLLLVAPAHRAANGQIAVGGDHGDYTGLPAAIQAVRALNDGPFVLYHRSLGSHFRFYLYAQTESDGSDNSVELRWFSSPVYLADNAAKTAYPPRFLIEPDWAPLQNLEPHLTMRDLELTMHGRYGRFTVWEISHREKPPCEWCVSRLPTLWPVFAGMQADAYTSRQSNLTNAIPLP